MEEDDTEVEEYEDNEEDDDWEMPSSIVDLFGSSLMLRKGLGAILYISM